MQTHARTLIQLDPQRTLRPHEHTLYSLTTAIADWQIHLDAHRIGVPLPLAPDIIPLRDANDTLFRARAVAHRTAQAEIAA